MYKITLLFVLGVCFSQIIYAQDTTKNKAIDSVYHNYLYDQRVAYFKELPVTKGGIVFLGNSITHWGDWAELLQCPAVKNRGIAGDISYGILARLDELINEKPRKIFIMIGVNDIGRKIPLANTINNYTKIITKLKTALPHTILYIQSVLPINDTLINRQYYTGTNAEIKVMNARLKNMAAAFNITYVDIYSLLADGTGQMPVKFTYDGIHLTAGAYIIWTNFLKRKGYCCN
jgi:lysophospholipase L1-like esterase